MEWIMGHWELLLAGFFLAEKIIKLTPTKYDDILVDIIGRTLIGKRK
jgi:hypothetical protein